MNKILMTYVILIKKGEITLEEAPEDYRALFNELKLEIGE